MSTPANKATSSNTQSDDNPSKTQESVPVASNATTNSTNKPQDSTSDLKAHEAGGPVNNGGNNGENDGVLVTDTQKKIRRAERFGMPVKLSEEEKRNSRAERFSTVPGSQGTEATKKSQELKMKARAERFGITQSMSTSDDEKKKARLARFASTLSAGPLEEQKKKARALRFSGTQANGTEKIESKTTIAGKAGGEA